MPLKQWIKRQVRKVIPRREPAPPAPKPRTPSLLQGIGRHQIADVVRHYETHVGAYQEVCGNIIQAGRPTSGEELLSHELEGTGLKDGEHVLDAGCGVCGPAIWFAQRRNATIEAVTITPIQREMAQEAIDQAGLSDRIRVQIGDYHHLDDLFAPATFDRVYFLESIAHAHNCRRVVEGAWKVLKPGGTLYIKDYLERDFSDDPATEKRAAEFLSKCYREYSFALLKEHEMASMLKEIGFQLEFMRPTPYANEKEDHSFLIRFEEKANFHWRDGIDLWVFEGFEVRAHKPA